MMSSMIRWTTVSIPCKVDEEDRRPSLSHILPGTMREKLEKGEYRSAQQVQKDFLLVMQNCIKYNDPDSDIVKEARRQTLLRPKVCTGAIARLSCLLAIPRCTN